MEFVPSRDQEFGFYVIKPCVLPAGRDQDGQLWYVEAQPGNLVVKLNTEEFVVFSRQFPYHQYVHATKEGRSQSVRITTDKKQ